MLIATPPSFPSASTPLQLPMPKLARDPGLTHEEADRVTLYLAELADAGRRGGGRCARMVVIGKGRGVSILIIAQAVDPHDYPVVKRGTAQRFLPLGRPAGRCLTHTHLGIATSLSCGPVASPHSVPAALYDRLTDTPTYAARMYKVQLATCPIFRVHLSHPPFNHALRCLHLQPR